ncbi:Crp/Fnr family transcriptional regulator [Bdellovibrio reynosensis]|uniref:Cyclic nucleotide-binding domain-containing protein n=1 Tax=Bdellovibrio reynosensis TaxID=2835041 RepID=A0ABY4CJW7_9BACT|nr:cyclic nucleotide-binding domain-containing protein [Bdellovibrio reynosensis]UOF02530.1 cyclic nucleotide-binding domain-containing protein [Bdellovibrio reynosensis]
MLNTKLLGKKFADHQLRKLDDGEILFREGDTSREMYVIQSGRIEVFKKVEGSTIVLDCIERGGIVGEMSMLESLPRSASARAIGKTTLVALDTGSFLLKIRRDPTFAFELMKQLSGRIRMTNEKLIILVNNEQVTKAKLKEVVENNL